MNLSCLACRVDHWETDGFEKIRGAIVQGQSVVSAGEISQLRYDRSTASATPGAKAATHVPEMINKRSQSASV